MQLNLTSFFFFFCRLLHNLNIKVFILLKNRLGQARNTKKFELYISLEAIENRPCGLRVR